MLDSPLSTRECADYLGYSREWVRRAITVGICVDAGLLVRLQAETLTIDGKRIYRVHRDHFLDFLRAIGWQRLPSLPVALPHAAIA